tara:strand:+ start:297 stop:485 length:189 start_codon:yes stop_codon:yes gene_type:complete
MKPERSQGVISIKDEKANTVKDFKIDNCFLESEILLPQHDRLLRPQWFKGSRDRGLRGDISA